MYIKQYMAMVKRERENWINSKSWRTEEICWLQSNSISLRSIRNKNLCRIKKKKTWPLNNAQNSAHYVIFCVVCVFLLVIAENIFLGKTFLYTVCVFSFSSSLYRDIESERLQVLYRLHNSAPKCVAGHGLTTNGNPGLSTSLQSVCVFVSFPLHTSTN